MCQRCLAVLPVLGILFSACTNARPLATEDAVPVCERCHGGGGSPAPPAAFDGATATTAVGVGAHQSHLRDGRLRAAVACTECHVVPVAVEDRGHIDADHADVTFGPLATTAGAAPTWDRATQSCGGTYCHGSFVGGAAAAPRWTQVDGSQAACGTCHRLPPPDPHPAVVGEGSCGACHPDTMTPAGAINVAGGHHIDGKVDAFAGHPDGWADALQHGYAANDNLTSCMNCHGVDLAGGTAAVSCDSCHQPGWRTNCTYCHGDAAAGRPSPPVGAQGHAATSFAGVGAHQAHLAARLASPLACTECHVVPTDVLSSGHLDGGGAELVFAGPRGTSEGAQPTYDRTAHTCAATYCHGTLRGGVASRPSWTVVDGSQKRCNSCHGNPPSTGRHGDHAEEGIGCGKCHPGSTSSSVTASTHVDGIVQVSPGSGTYSNGTCSNVGCHGSHRW